MRPKHLLLAAVAAALVGCSDRSPSVTSTGDISTVRQELSASGGEKVEVLVVQDRRTGETWVVYDPSKLTAVHVLQGGSLAH